MIILIRHNNMLIHRRNRMHNTMRIYRHPYRHSRRCNAIIGTFFFTAHRRLCGHAVRGRSKEESWPQRKVREAPHKQHWAVHGDRPRLSTHRERLAPARAREQRSGKQQFEASALSLCPRCNAFVLDRACKFEKAARQDPALPQLEHIAVDKWHQHGHNSNCKNSPKNVPALKRRSARVNSSIAKQTCSWFRGYARLFNNMRPVRHHFVVLLARYGSWRVSSEGPFRLRLLVLSYGVAAFSE